MMMIATDIKLTISNAITCEFMTRTIHGNDTYQLCINHNLENGNCNDALHVCACLYMETGVNCVTG